MKINRLLCSIAVIALLAGPASAGQVAFTPGSGGNIGAAADGSSNLYPGGVVCGNGTLATLFATIQNCAIVNSSGEIYVDASHETLSIANPAQGVFGSAGPNTGNAMGVNATSGGTLAPMIQATASIKIDTAAASTVQLVALSSGKAVYVTAYNAIAGGTTNVTFEYGTGSLCASGTTTLTGAYPLTAQAGLAPAGSGPILFVPAGNALCMVNSQAIQVSGVVSYAQF